MKNDASKAEEQTRRSSATSSVKASTSSEDGTSALSTDDESLTPQQRKEVMRQKKNCAIKILITIFPRIPKVTNVLLEFFVKRHNKLSLERDPLSHFCREQCVLAAQDCLRKLHLQYITYQDIRDMIENLVGLHSLCLKRAPDKAEELGLMVRKLTIIVGELATSLEKISEVPVTDWMAVGDAVAVKTEQEFPTRHIGLAHFIPKTSDLECIKLLGAGGFGVVYKALYKPANLICVLKMVARERFLRPQQACMDKVVASVVKSPFLVKYHACFATRGAYVSMMDYVGGTDFHRVLEHTAFLPIDQVQIVMAQLTLAVEHLHLKGLVHRDIKISNMLVVPGGRVKLIDLDTNRICLGHFTKRAMKGYFRRTPFEFHDGECAGTIPYMAPEVIKRRPYGRACDWWSAGVVFYKLMTGRVPFRGKTRTIIRDRIMATPLKWPKTSQHPHSATPAAKDMVYLLLQKNPVDRLGSKKYQDIRTHAFFDEFDWHRLKESNALFHIPVVGGLTQTDPALTNSEETQNNNVSPVESKECKKRKLLRLEDMVDLDRSQHIPLYTYASPTFKRIVTTVSETNEPTKVAVPEGSFSSSSEIDYQKTTDTDSVYFNSFSGSTISIEGKSTDRATEKLDLIVFRKKSFGRFWSFGVNLQQVMGESGQNYFIVESMKRGSPAQRSQILQGDIVVAVNGTKVGELPLTVVRQIMDSSEDQMVLTVLSSSTNRIVSTRQDVLAILQSSARQTMTVAMLRSGCRHSASYGFTTIAARTWDQQSKEFVQVHIVQKVKDVHIRTRDRRLFPGDILTHVDDTPLDKVTQVVLRKWLSKARSELQITIALLSPLRRKRPSFTRLHETLLTDDSVDEPSCAAAIEEGINECNSLKRLS
ncbi:microtubule-associated serine/threonine-protein kinase 4-like [Ornithodoros turicata]|uniref:microtubule-associated serine/threonine-protein kinase 4-like n=1 Tax=Ornithodoros turicata TaxID=34597 RepID=UPI0031387BBB